MHCSAVEHLLLKKKSEHDEGGCLLWDQLSVG
jgi:hypothetical protein